MRLRVEPILSFALLLLCTTAFGQKFSAASAPELDQLFQRTNGWIGADGAYSIPLSRHETLWLFSDTWIGRVENGKRVDAGMINNTIAIQRHGRPAEFYFPTNAEGKAQSFIKPADGRGFFWLFPGTRTGEGVFFFLKQVEIVDNKSVFGFRGFSTSLAHVKNPDDHPSKWRISQTVFPFDSRVEENSLTLGSAVMNEKGYVYVYGNRSGKDKGANGMVVARVREKEFATFSKWEFFSNGTWTNRFEALTAICNDAPSEASVSYWPALKKYVFVYIPGFWGQIVLRTSDKPTGPWSDPIKLYEAPEMKYPAKVFAYAGKAHPQLSTAKDELIVTYAANSFDIHEVVKDARLYWPRFVRVKLEREDR